MFFRDPDHTWTNSGSKLYSGVGSCKEMYPCPFNVQEAIGIHIPVKNNTTEGFIEEENDDTVYMSFVNEEDLIEVKDNQIESATTLSH